MSSSAYRLIAIVLLAAALAIVVYRMASTPSRLAGRLGRRGMRRREAIAKSEKWAQVEPIVRWTGLRLSGLLPERLVKHLDAQILYAGDYLGLLGEEYAAICVLSSMVGALVGAVIDIRSHTRGLAMMGFCTIGLIGPYLQLTGISEERRQKINRALPYAVDLMALSMSAGLDFPGAIRQFVANALDDDPLAEELSFLLQSLQLGHTRRTALLELAERVPTDAIREFVQTIVQAEEKGTPVIEVLAVQATVSRQRRTTRAEETAAKAGVKMAVPLTLLMMSIILLFMAPAFLKIDKSLKHVDSGARHAAHDSRKV